MRPDSDLGDGEWKENKAVDDEKVRLALKPLGEVNQAVVRYLGRLGFLRWVDECPLP